MSFNLGTKLNNLMQAVEHVENDGLTNPLQTDLDGNSHDIINLTSISAVNGSNLSLNASNDNAVVVNTNLVLPNHTLTIANSTPYDGLIVQNGTPPNNYNYFRVDTDGRVGVNVGKMDTLNKALSVNGDAVISGNLTCSSITGTSFINNITAGVGISKTGTQSNPIINNSGVISLTAGSGINITGTNGNLTISTTALSASVGDSAGVVGSVTGIRTQTNTTLKNAFTAIKTILENVQTNQNSQVTDAFVTLNSIISLL